MMIDNWVFIRRRIVGQRKQRQWRRRNLQGENLFHRECDFFLQLMVVGGEGNCSINRNQPGHQSCAEAYKIKLRITEI